MLLAGGGVRFFACLIKRNIQLILPELLRYNLLALGETIVHTANDRCFLSLLSLCQYNATNLVDHSHVNAMVKVIIANNFCELCIGLLISLLEPAADICIALVNLLANRPLFLR